MIHPEPLKSLPSHLPVLLNEVIEMLNIKPSDTFLDGTLGLAGHSSSVLSRLNKSGRLIGVDCDLKAIEYSKNQLSKYSNNFSLYHNTYENIDQILNSLKIKKVDAILLDLGLSSMQLDSPERGFSFNCQDDLDMRFNLQDNINALDLITFSSEKELADIIYKYGEERKSRIIAKSIKNRTIKKVPDLVEAINKVTHPRLRRKTLTKVFQALRISVNNELWRLEKFINVFYKYLNVGGRIVIISFHSLEDRIVKHSFKDLYTRKELILINKKPIQASAEELSKNSRSRSAKMRVAEKI